MTEDMVNTFSKLVTAGAQSGKLTLFIGSIVIFAVIASLQLYFRSKLKKNLAANREAQKVSEAKNPLENHSAEVSQNDAENEIEELIKNKGVN